LRRFAKVLRRRVKRVGGRAVAVLVVNAVLAPDVALHGLHSQFFARKANVVGGQKTRDEGARTVAAHETFDGCQGVAQVAVDLRAVVVAISEVAAGNESHVVAVARVHGTHRFAQTLEMRARVV